MSFELVEPDSLPAALALLDPEDPGVRAIAGGTALMLMLKSGFFRPRRLVSLRRIGDGMSGIRASAEGGLVLGAMARLRDIERAPAVWQRAPVVVETLRVHSNIRVRNVATIGGNLAHGDPHMDLPPVLIVLGAHLTATGPGGSRTIAAEDLVSGYFETVLGNDELITEIAIPPQGARRAAYQKCTTRAADDWPALGVAVSLGLEGAAIREARVAVGAVTDRPVRLRETEALLRGGAVGESLWREAGEVAAREVEPVGDDRGSALYKRQLLRVAMRRALAQAAGAAG
ncbi:MAG TPA: xanthine dehydrogenase family protein subunit M [Stellaceae bacterium]|nr:xanthine dehydrogenase family protein subunit M [Stellaceae bacterium]